MSGDLCRGDPEQWFFFTPLQKREARGGRPNRTTASGYWKATGSPGYVYSSGNRVIGTKKTMVFYKGKAPSGRKTKWKMNEYRAVDGEATASSSTVPKRLKAVVDREQEAGWTVVVGADEQIWAVRSNDQRGIGNMAVGVEEPTLAGIVQGGEVMMSESWEGRQRALLDAGTVGGRPLFDVSTLVEERPLPRPKRPLDGGRADP
ncbi:hypothetical protein HHK36_019361 [Tetracentron sinense]|uniref:NAC domain-containing protein n=1 Tax=Tetracentron sinense TaxID=13715 RepID=A0A834YXE4_TETSI|nr:hypothetical protein HHK36_019361 [Tetracentron sinense]